MENIEKILGKYGWLKRKENININFQQIEDMTGFKLPLDYKMYAENFYGNENSIGNEYVRLWDCETELLEANEDYEIFKNLKKTIAIGGNGGGEFIGIQNFRNNELRIILCPFMGMSEEYFIEIGKSFTDFLISLENGKNWFE
ncbi:SMI1/KNR4 family protein [Halpernia frigidisoli]|uniref:SMI1 / KNR4 family (SUKH-1) n=1 Tax=Halpernia frigidisoli TaxID=1125876 RepID=A0A1I3F0Z6_9FLAO|nr:SMI1/KNR4 family protein [Halpernia frigidisoli]SFI04877.1 SMI1 / KNR4 family (SUKH-1) [Halpernia frigidisoli]